MACRESLSLASDHLLPKIRAASDCRNNIRSIGGDEQGAYRHIVQELKARTGDFYTVQFVREGRASNDVHMMARGSISRDIGGMCGFKLHLRVFTLTII
jgi:hypothetical protein